MKKRLRGRMGKRVRAIRSEAKGIVKALAITLDETASAVARRVRRRILGTAGGPPMHGGYTAPIAAPPASSSPIAAAPPASSSPIAAAPPASSSPIAEPATSPPEVPAVSVTPQTSSSRTEGCQESARFEVIAPTQMGEEVYVVGNHPALGNWCPEAGVQLTPSAYPRWEATVPIPSPLAELEYKYVRRNANGSFAWEKLEGNRRMALVSQGMTTAKDEIQWTS